MPVCLSVIQSTKGQWSFRSTLGRHRVAGPRRASFRGLPTGRRLICDTIPFYSRAHLFDNRLPRAVLKGAPRLEGR